MIRWLYDLLFTRSEWKIIRGPIRLRDAAGNVGDRYVIQNQWGKIKKVDII